MSIIGRLWHAVFGVQSDGGSPTEADRPRTDAERLALAVLAGDEEAALALADLVLMTYHRLAQIPPGVTFESAAWPWRARNAFRRLGIRSFQQLLGTRANDLLRQPDFGQTTLKQVRDILARFGLSLSGEEGSIPRPEPPRGDPLSPTSSADEAASGLASAPPS